MGGNLGGIAISAETDILQALIAAGTGGDADDGASDGSGDGEAAPPDLWPAFLGRLVQDTRAGAAELALSFQGRPLHRWRVGEGAAEAPLPPQAEARMRIDRVYSQSDLPGLAEDAPPLRAIRWTVTAEAGAVLCLHRASGEFRAIDGLQLTRLTPHAGPILAAWLRLGAERAAARRDRGLAAALGTGWIVFAASGAVQEMSPGLAARLSAAGVRIRANGQLSLPTEAAALALRQALAAALAGASSLPVELVRDPAVQIVLEAERAGTGLAVVGRLRLAPRARDLPVGRVAAGFGLSRNEARLALAIGDAQGLAEAAADLGWTVETARSYSKQIFAKLGVAGQPALVRRLANSAIWLAPRS